METLSYTTKDKSTWGPGPWQDEPDKVQYTDPVTGLPCLLVRNHAGAWCGYVGVDQRHALYGIGYNDLYKKGYELHCHGGLTFSGFCHENDDNSKGICHLPSPGEPEKIWWLGFDCAHYMDYSPAMMAELRSIPDLKSTMWAHDEDVYRDIEYVKFEVAGLAVLAKEINKTTPPWLAWVRRQNYLIQNEWFAKQFRWINYQRMRWMTFKLRHYYPLERRVRAEMKAKVANIKGWFK